jgi:uncharacterized protein (DUF2147 family)
MIGMRKWVGLLALVAACACSTSAPPAPPAGRWITASHNLIVAIGPCGETMCGAVEQVLANNSMTSTGTSAVRPLDVGFHLITGLRRDGDHWTGRIFNREDGRTYDCTVRVLANGALEVHPYVETPLLGRTQIWPRAR